jgi:hypothetical protein
MRVFVCSRLNELEPERKAVIDSLAIVGCTPINFERQISVYEDKAAKLAMDRMVNEAEALVFIYPRWKGKPRRLLRGQTPTQYEFGKFYKKIKKMGRDVQTYIHLYRKSVIEESELDEFMKGFPDVRPIAYDNHVQLAGFIYDLGRRLRGSKHGSPPAASSPPLVVRYNGPDFRGLVEKLSDLLYRGLKEGPVTHPANIDRISFASGAGVATLYISCSFSSEGLPDLRVLGKILNEEMRKEIAEAKKDGRLNRSVRIRNLIDVTHGDHEEPPFQLYLEVRTIDQPGQVYAVARVLKEERYNVDELQLKPAEKGYPGQTVMAISVSKERGQGTLDELERDLLKLETAIRELGGVRAFSVRVMGAGG